MFWRFRWLWAYAAESRQRAVLASGTTNLNPVAPATKLAATPGGGGDTPPQAAALGQRTANVEHKSSRPVRRRCQRFARCLPPMRPWQALLLYAIHRRSPRRLAEESPARLHRDIQRFCLSSSGKRLLKGRPQPTQEQVTAWVQSAQRYRLRHPSPNAVR